jgi:hypothetical protein
MKVHFYIEFQLVKRLPVDSLLAIIGKEGEDISALLSGKPAEATQLQTQQNLLQRQ